MLLYALAYPLPSPFTAVHANDSSLVFSVDTQPHSLITLDNCGDIRSCRTTEEIIYSCLAVIFACTWVAIHPNVPRLFVKGEYKNETEEFYEICDSFSIHPAVVTLLDVLFMLLALLFPELVVLWAMRQWVAARKLAGKYQGE